MKIADINVFGKDDIDTLRNLVKQAKQLEKDSRNVEALFREFVDSRSVTEAKAVADVEDGLGMRWEKARDLFLVWLKENRSKDTYRTYRSALGAACKSTIYPSFEPINGRPIAAITTADLAMVRNRINVRGKRGEAKGRSIRQADLTVAALKAAWLHFINEPETFGIGIANVVTDDLRKVRDREERPESSSGATERTMNQIELGMFFEEVGAVRNEMSRLILSLQLLTGQRRLDVCSAISESFVEREDYGIVWRLEDKTHSWRVLPLPSIAQDIVRGGRKDHARYKSRYLFPKNRKKKKSDPEVDGHISERTPSKMMELMRGEDGPFEGSLIDPSTHDLRKAFITYFTPRIHNYSVGGRQLTKDDIQMITHMDEGRETTAKSPNAWTWTSCRSAPDGIWP
ncbi:hypothetical protein [Pararhizobium sp. LjRoot238]|uniref:hypothetical protein n=1 Tax=Pararhizobium sp. LjRoot238 TaxID=3342293 RepID=UPI003ECE3F61